MKIAFDGIENLFDCAAEDYRWTLVIENPRKMAEVITDLAIQAEGSEGRTVLSEDNRLLRIDKNLELLTRFIPFDLNRKVLINKITAKFQETALREEYFLQTQQVLGQWEKLCLDLSLEFPGDLNFTKISAETLFKAAGIEIENDYARLSEKLLDYFELVEAYEGKKVFVLVNLRSFIENVEMEAFLKEIIKRRYEVLFLECMAREGLPGEKIFIVDENLCGIC